MSMFFLMHAKIEYKYRYKHTAFKILMFLMNTLWFFSFLIATTVAFLPILPSSLFAPVFTFLPISITKIGVVTGLIAVLLYVIFALVGLIGLQKDNDFTKSDKIKQIVLFAFSLAIPTALAFSLSKVLNLGFSAILMLAATFTYISYLGTGMRLKIPIFESENESFDYAMELMGFHSRDAYKERISKEEWRIVNKFFKERRKEVDLINEEIFKSNSKILRKTMILINVVHVIYIILAVGATVLLIVSTKRTEIAKIWASLLIYAPAFFTVTKIISNIIVMFKDKKKKKEAYGPARFKEQHDYLNLP